MALIWSTFPDCRLFLRSTLTSVFVCVRRNFLDGVWRFTFTFRTSWWAGLCHRYEAQSESERMKDAQPFGQKSNSWQPQRHLHVARRGNSCSSCSSSEGFCCQCLVQSIYLPFVNMMQGIKKTTQEVSVIMSAPSPPKDVTACLHLQTHRCNMCLILKVNTLTAATA